MERKALKLALDVLETERDIYREHDEDGAPEYMLDAITSIKVALAQPAQEPVAWITPDGEGFRIRFSAPTNDVPLGWDALYTTPPKREWVGLTDEEYDEIWRMDLNNKELMDKTITKLKEKNT